MNIRKADIFNKYFNDQDKNMAMTDQTFPKQYYTSDRGYPP